jgi:hypothetical protein
MNILTPMIGESMQSESDETNLTLKLLKTSEQNAISLLTQKPI